MQSDHSILIVGSQPDGRSRLREVLAGLRESFPHRVIGEADSAQGALDQVRAHRPSLLLVDTALNDMDAIEFGRHVQSVASQTPERVPQPGGESPLPQLIYVSGSDRYALDAFEVKALDYLLKPVGSQRLMQALSRADGPVLVRPNGRLASPSDGIVPASDGGGAARVVNSAPRFVEPASPPQSCAPPGALLPAPPAVRSLAPPARRHFAVHERGRLMLVPVEQVIYLKAELKYVTVRTRQREYLIEDSLTALEAEFGERFVRVHRNALVSRACVAGFERVAPDGRAPGAEPHWQVVLRDVPERLAVSRRQWSTVRHLMG